jgi:hypothetical protein
VCTVASVGDKPDTVYVDPYTATVKGSLVTWFDDRALRP